MLILGAGGFAKEVLEIFHQKKSTDDIAFYDDVNPDNSQLLFNRFPILKNESQVKDFFAEHGPAFTIGIGQPSLRYMMYRKFISLGGQLASAISPRAVIGSFDVSIGNGCNILDGAVFSNATSTGMGCIVYYNSVITHDCRLGDFVQVAPGVTVLGGATIGDFSLIGANVTILPRLTIGKSVVIAAGAVITKNVPDYALMIGNPARHMGWVSYHGNKLSFNEENKAICSTSGEIYLLQDDLVVRNYLTTEPR